VARPVQFVEEKHVGLVPGDSLRRAEPAACLVSLADDPWHADKILGRELGAQQRVALQSDLHSELLDQARLADAGLSPDENRPYHREMQKEFG
jgi:hypothetical protein